MKHLCKIILFVVLFFCIAIPVLGDFDPDIDYSVRMVEAILAGDDTAGYEAQRERDEKIASLGLDYAPIDYGELLLLSQLIYTEAGSYWLGTEWKMAVGEVVLNRVASPEFPDTLREVITQPGQYHGPAEGFLDYVSPNRDSINAALRILSGERVINDPAVVFQSNMVLGSGVALELWDENLGSTFLCYSSRMDLYRSEKSC